MTIAAFATGCVPAARPPAPAPAPMPVPRPQPAAPAAGPDWRDWPLTPGTWRYRRDARGSIAEFGTTAGPVALSLRCDPAARRLYLTRAGSVTTPLIIRTSTMLRSVAVQPTGATPPSVTAAFMTTDTVLEAIGFSRGRFVVEQAGLAPLVIPAWAEIERVTEDCRG